MAGITCSACGAENEELVVFCGACSADLNNQPVTKVSVVAKPVEIPVREDALLCEYNGCGLQLRTTDAECPKCGAPRPGTAAPGVEAATVPVSGVWRVTLDDQELLLNPGEVVMIGRDFDAKLSLALQRFMSVSRRHIRLEVSETGSSVKLIDEGSSYGSRVGAEQIHDGSSVTIESQVEVILGGQVSIRLGPA